MKNEKNTINSIINVSALITKEIDKVLNNLYILEYKRNKFNDLRHYNSLLKEYILRLK